MEFKFPVNEIFKQPLVEIGANLIPPGFSGDRRSYWDTVGKVSEVVNAMGEASATAQGLTKPITTAERLRNSEHTIYLLVDQNAGNGRGAVTGLLKTGKKGLYVFDRNGQHFQVSPPCVLDFYVHESRQRNGLGKRLFEHMLQKEQVEPVKMAIDRPSEKFLGFLNKHYTLNNPVKQMNNYVVFDGFFPSTPEKNAAALEINNQSAVGTPGKKLSANGLQAGNYASPMGRYGAPRPHCSMGQIIHNQSSTLAKSTEPTGTKSAPETNFQIAANNNSPPIIPMNPMNPTQSAPNMYYQNNQQQQQFNLQNVNQSKNIRRINSQQNSDNVWQSMHTDGTLNQDNYYNNSGQVQNVGVAPLSQQIVEAPPVPVQTHATGDFNQVQQMEQQQLFQLQQQQEIERQQREFEYNQLMQQQQQIMQAQAQQEQVVQHQTPQEQMQQQAQHQQIMQPQVQHQQIMQPQVQQEQSLQQQVQQQQIMQPQVQHQQSMQQVQQEQIIQQQGQQQQIMQPQVQQEQSLQQQAQQQQIMQPQVQQEQILQQQAQQQQFVQQQAQQEQNMQHQLLMQPQQQQLMQPQIQLEQILQQQVQQQMVPEQIHTPTPMVQHQNPPQEQLIPAVPSRQYLNGTQTTPRRDEIKANYYQQPFNSPTIINQRKLELKQPISVRDLMQNFEPPLVKNQYENAQHYHMGHTPQTMPTIKPQHAVQNIHSQYQMPPQPQPIQTNFVESAQKMSSRPQSVVSSQVQIAQPVLAQQEVLPTNQIMQNSNMTPHTYHGYGLPPQSSMQNLSNQPSYGKIMQQQQQPNVTQSVNYLGKSNTMQSNAPSQHSEEQYSNVGVKSQEGQMHNAGGDMGANAGDVYLGNLMSHGYPPQTSGSFAKTARSDVLTLPSS